MGINIIRPTGVSVASQEEELNTGFVDWTSGADANTYTITDGKFQIDRSGYGYIKGSRVSWAAGQQTSVLEINLTSWVYIDSSGLIGVTSSVSSLTYVDNIVLYEVLFDGTVYKVVRENHPYSFGSKASSYLHNNIGNVIRGEGAVVTRVGSGTGSVAADREIHIVGADYYEDHGIITAIPDSVGAGVTWDIWGRWDQGGGNQWYRYIQQTEIPQVIAGGTALSVVSQHIVYTLYVTKDTIEDVSPQYIAVMPEVIYGSYSDAQDAIRTGAVTYATGTLASLELAQLGYAIINYSVDGGYIRELLSEKSSLSQRVVLSGEVAKIDTNNNLRISNSNSIYLGKDSGIELTTQTNNVFIGKDSGKAATTSSGNVIIGPSAGKVATNLGSNTVMVGYFAGGHSTYSGSSNTLVGEESGYRNTGSFNSSFGRYSGYINSGDYNVFNGYQSGKNNIGNYNTIEGAEAGYSNSGNNTLLLGYQAGYNNTGDAVVLIGNKAGYNNTVDNRLYIANTDTVNPLIYGEFDTKLAKINGEFEVKQSLDGAGIVSIGVTSYSVVQGIGTSFLTDFAASDSIKVNGETKLVAAVIDNTLMVIDVLTSGVSGVTYSRVGPGTVTVALSGTTAVSGTSTTFTTTFSPGETIIANGESHVIDTITDDFNLNTLTTWATSFTDVTYSELKPGTVSAIVTNSNLHVYGSGTRFTQDFKVGSALTANAETHTVASILTNTHMTTDAWAADAVAATYATDGTSNFKVLGNGNIEGINTDSTSAATSGAFGSAYQISIANMATVTISIRCVTTAASGAAYVEVKSDSSATPTTVIATAGIESGLLDEDNTFMFTFIVKRGDYYKVDKTETNGTVTIKQWRENIITAG